MSRIETSTIEKLVFDVQKPGRYIGGEFNAIIKDKAAVRMAVSYPDMYELGMSNNGLAILYSVINSISGLACERVFAVAHDFEDKLRHNNIPLYTLETYTPLNELDIIGFNISYELLYTNLLQIIDLGKIPIFSKDRGNNCPLIIAGGESVSNPLPMSDFIDLFYIGDGEEGILEILNAIKDAKSKNLSRNDIIESLEGIKGILIPSGYSISYSGRSVLSIRKFCPRLLFGDNSQFFFICNISFLFIIVISVFQLINF